MKFGQKKRFGLIVSFILLILGWVLGQVLPINSFLQRGRINWQNLSPEEIKAAKAYLKFKRLKKSLIPSGQPVYAQELSVSYDQVDQAVERLARLEEEIGLAKLSQEERERYLKIGQKPGTACEFCCGVKTMVNEQGQRACGCAHNRALSGLTMWLIKNGYQEKEILAEIENWRRLFFPKQTLSARLNQLQQQGDQEIKEILQEFPDFLPDMVGGC